MTIRLSATHKDEYANFDSNDMNGVGFQRYFNARNCLDASVSFRIGKALEVRLDASNLTKTRTFEYFKNFDPSTVALYGADQSRTENGFQAGRTLQLTLRGSFWQGLLERKTYKPTVRRGWMRWPCRSMRITSSRLTGVAFRTCSLKQPSSRHQPSAPSR